MRKFSRFGLAVLLMLVSVIGVGTFTSDTVSVVEANPGTNWNAYYYNNADLSGSPVLTRVDSVIDFNWGNGTPAGVPVDANYFSVRWTKTVNFDTSGQWVFRAGADDGIRVWIDVTLIIDEWHGNTNGYATYEVALDALTAGNHDITVEYYEATGNAGVQFIWWSTSGGGSSVSNGPFTQASWTAKYYNNTSLSGSEAKSGTEGAVNFNWGANSPSNVNADNFSARYTASVYFAWPGRWQFKVGADDGVRVWVDVTQIVDEWHGNSGGYTEYIVEVPTLTVGNHDLTVEFYEETGDARIYFEWSYIGTAGNGGGGASSGDSSAAVVATARPPSHVYAAVTGNNVNVRTGPGRGYPVIRKLDYPDDYLVLAGVPDLSWLRIQLEDGSEGWVSNEWVWLWPTDDDLWEDTTGGGMPDFVDIIPRDGTADLSPPTLPLEGPPRVILNGYSTDVLNFRDGPTLYASKVIGSIPVGATFTVEAHNGNGAWYLIEYQGIRGWVSGSYVALTDGTVTELVVSSEVVDAPPMGTVFVPEDETGNPAVTVRGRAKSNLRLRDAASLNGDQVASVPRLSEFVIEGRNSNGAWYLITWEGQSGWVNSPYVELLEGTVSDLLIR